MVMRALERNAEARYLTAGEMAEDLEKVLFEMRASPHEPRKLLASLFPQGPSRTRRGPASIPPRRRRDPAAAAVGPDPPRAAAEPDAFAVGSARRRATPPNLGRPTRSWTMRSPTRFDRRASARKRRRRGASGCALGCGGRHRRGGRSWSRSRTGAVAPAEPNVAPAAPAAGGAARARAGAAAGAGPRQATVRDLARLDPAGREGRSGRTRARRGPHAADDRAAAGERGDLVPVREGSATRSISYKVIPDLDKSVRAELLAGPVDEPKRALRASHARRAVSHARGPAPKREVRPSAPAVVVPSAAEQPRDCLMSIGSFPWSELWIDGKDTGQRTPVVHYPVSCGGHKLALKRRDLKLERVQQVTRGAGPRAQAALRAQRRIRR